VDNKNEILGVPQNIGGFRGDSPLPSLSEFRGGGVCTP